MSWSATGGARRAAFSRHHWRTPCSDRHRAELEREPPGRAWRTSACKTATTGTMPSSSARRPSAPSCAMNDTPTTSPISVYRLNRTNRRPPERGPASRRWAGSLSFLSPYQPRIGPGTGHQTRRQDRSAGHPADLHRRNRDRSSGRTWATTSVSRLRRLTERHRYAHRHRELPRMRWPLPTPWIRTNRQQRRRLRYPVPPQSQTANGATFLRIVGPDRSPVLAYDCRESDDGQPQPATQNGAIQVQSSQDRRRS